MLLKGKKKKSCCSTFHGCLMLRLLILLLFRALIMCQKRLQFQGISEHSAASIYVKR